MKRNLYNTFIVVVAHLLCVMPFVVAYQMLAFYSGAAQNSVGILWIPFTAILFCTVLSVYSFFRGWDIAAVYAGLIPVVTMVFLMNGLFGSVKDILGSILLILFFLTLLNVEALNKRKYAVMRALPLWWIAVALCVAVFALSASILFDMFMR